ncbi:UDP-N-acetylglucosamine 1-carboxyvinyltransferase [Paenactinomyces guangxiensis]|uniref:UDP-N-acetylglucosamine 1-carboxyvinyltransferase n=1 Tax=Paenactinomyces guangxiensis TaxID=1490290 RepID=A0A7W1WQ51_9BACL|nr:UDP-N-acetylglucosamine 1-carboxyvinyltransferase [Paenactinomyces guangxiensis]MBA4494019.1 UDP-N-acetylglucosamine 1-carboxyvinyltransferase [Paenactinomyces guangxiensis]MBH8591236.1 UDP-N-acetylglucosamine 1-carboxyvinyltransferase [Paenactinomyces guangxiensis]
MEKLVIKGGHPLHGSVKISGAKNSALAMIPATLLADSPSVLENIPDIRDVAFYIEVLHDLGAVVTRTGAEITIDPSPIRHQPVLSQKVNQLRASYYLMGVLLGKWKEVTIGTPGGCNLGLRPIDQHIKGFQALGTKVVQEDGVLRLIAPKLQGARIYLDVVSVGATINIMFAAACADGKTVIENAAKEPEVIDVATLLSSMGAVIKGAGTDIIRIQGVKRLHGCRHTIIPDRIEAGTYMIAAAATEGEVLIEQIIPKHLESVSAKLREMGVQIQEEEESIFVKGSSRYTPVDIKTLPYPGFPTDLQQPFTSLLTRAHGTSLVTDNIYSSRFEHVSQLEKMGAKIKVEGRTAIVEGMIPLHGARVHAFDLRAGASLVIAALMAEDVTWITGTNHIDRGYEQLEQKLARLKAEIRRE